MEAPQQVSPLRIAFLVGSLLCLSLSWTFGCVRADDTDEDGVREPSRRAKADATARLSARPGDDAHGFVRFVRADDGVRVIAELAGMPPGEHGFHVHEKGDCSAPDFESAGEHFTTSPHAAHGMPADVQRHTGDLGNILVDGNGTASLDRKDAIIALDGDRSVIGRALIVHERGDDGKDPKSAGGRILCGVIERGDVGGLPERGDDAPAPSAPAERVPTQPGNHTIPPLTPPPPVLP